MNYTNNQTFNPIGKVMDRGLIVIPKQIREEAGFVANSYVQFERRDDGIIMRPVDVSGGLRIIPAKLAKEEALNLLKKIRGTWTKKDFASWKQMRKDSKQRMEKIDRLEPYWEK